MGTKGYIKHHERQMAELIVLRNMKDVGDVHEKCTREMEDGSFRNCSRMFIDDTQGRVFCNTCVNPTEKWRLGDCNMADTFLKATYVEQKKKINPLKASKRKRRNR